LVIPDLEQRKPVRFEQIGQSPGDLPVEVQPVVAPVERRFGFAKNLGRQGRDYPSRDLGGVAKKRVKTGDFGG